jgi:hypothetical protein
VIVTDVPPATSPVVGLIAVTTGAEAAKVNWSEPEVGDVPSGVVTVMSTVPADSAGLTATIEVAETTV